jgi:hypothetical protein
MKGFGIASAVLRVMEAVVGLLVTVLLTCLRAAARMVLDPRTSPFGCIVNAVVVLVVLGAVMHGCGQ